MAGLIPFNRRNLSVRPQIQGDIFNMLDDFFSDNWLSGRSLLNDTFKMDVREDEESYTVEAELPGVKKEEIGLMLENGCLSVSVNREAEREDQGKNYLHRERRYSSMRRSIYLSNADEQRVKAKLEDGVLHISIGKLTKENGRAQIEIE